MHTQFGVIWTYGDKVTLRTKSAAADENNPYKWRFRILTVLTRLAIMNKKAVLAIHTW